jgi:hypothetical protein
MGMLLVRLHEVSALAELDEVSKSAVFVESAPPSSTWARASPPR